MPPTFKTNLGTSDNPYRVIFDNAVCTGYGNTWEEGVENAKAHLRRILRGKYKQIGEVYMVKGMEHGTEFVYYHRGIQKDPWRDKMREGRGESPCTTP